MVQNRDIDLRPLLEKKTRDELKVLAKRLRVSGFSRLHKQALINSLLRDRTALGAALCPSWWRRHHNHVYGVASILDVVLAVLFFTWSRFDVLRERGSSGSGILHEIHDSDAPITTKGISDDSVTTRPASVG